MSRTFGLPVLTLLVVTALSGCASGSNGSAGGDGNRSKDSHQLAVSKDDFGKAWPFTVSEGELTCRNDSVTFSAEGRRYALNGTAKAQLGLPGIEPIWKDAAYGLKKNVGPMIQRGLKLC